METTRTFIAVNLPENVKKEIFERLSSKIDKKTCKVVEQENLHVTMKFLGYLNDNNLGNLREKIKGLSELKKFEIELKGIGSFKGRVIWLGIEKGNEELKIISEKLDEFIGVKDEKFHPHVTLARNKEMGRKEADELIGKLGKENYSAIVKVESVDLMKSELSSKGPKYAVIERVELA